MKPGRATRRIIGFLVHNWPLKLAAVVLATLLYAGLVASQDSNTYPGPIQVLAINQPSGTIVTNELRDVDQVRYIAPIEVGRLRAEDFRATVDLAGVKPTGTPTSVRVSVVATDPRVTILDVQPRTISVVLDESVSADVQVRVERGPIPSGIDVGETVFVPKTATITGPSASVKRVVAVRVTVALDPGGIDFDRDVEGDPIDGSGEVVNGVDVEPRTVHVTVPLFTNKQSRTLPVNPVVTGEPAPGFRIASVTTTPIVVSVEGDAEQLTKLTQADTAPVEIFGSTRDVTATVALALPPGVVTLGAGKVDVVVKVEPVTETRTFAAGFRLDGRGTGLTYTLSDNAVLLTVFGSTADLDRLGSAPLIVGISVAGLGPGVHTVPVVPSIPSGVTVAAIAPDSVTITIADIATPSPPPATASPATPEPSASPSTTP